MSGNLHKSEAGWVRLRARVNAREGVRAAQMDHRVSKPKPEGGKPEGKVRKGRTTSPDTIVVNGRTQRRAFTAHNGRSE